MRFKPKSDNNSSFSLENIYAKPLELIGRELQTISHVNKVNNLRLPKGIAITTYVFDEFIKENKITDDIINHLKSVQPFFKQTAEDASKEISTLIMEHPLPAKHLEEMLSVFNAVFSFKDSIFLHFFPSQIIEPEHLVKNQQRKEHNVEIRNINDLIYQIKLQWAKLFSVDALEYRANRYYRGPIAMAISITEPLYGEMSGSFYSLLTTEPDKNSVELHARYGLEDKEISINPDEGHDVYKLKVEKNDVHIFEKKINLQQQMLIKNGNKNSKNGLYTVVDISPSWRNKQKLMDEFITSITKSSIELERLLKKTIRIDWVLKSGFFYVSNIAEFTVDNENLINKADHEDLKIKDNNDQARKGFNLEKIKQEIDELKMKLDKASTDDDRNEVKNSLGQTIASLQVFERQKSKKATSKSDLSIKSSNTDSSFIIDITNRQSDTLDISKIYQGAFLDGTSLLVEQGNLPENQQSSADTLEDYIYSIFFDISTLYKVSSAKDFFYQLPHITDYEYNFLKYAGKKYIGDDRYLHNPVAANIEIEILRRFITQDYFQGVNIIFPGLRNTTNLTRILDSFSKKGIASTEKVNFFADVSIPTFLIEVSKLPFALIDGLILHYDSLLYLLNTKSGISELDHTVILDIIEDIINKTLTDLKIYIRISMDLPEHALKRIAGFKYDGIIWSKLPNKKALKQLS